MKGTFSRRNFVKSSLVFSAGIPLSMREQDHSTVLTSPEPTRQKRYAKVPMGMLGDQEFSRLILGGNLIGGFAHSRDLPYVSTLMRRYNTEPRIRETLELAESVGINAINTWVMQENRALFNHWKSGGKMKWFAQIRLDENSGYSQIQRAVDEGATAIHITGDAAYSLLQQGQFEKVAETVQLIKSKKRIAGVAAHELEVIVECEKAKLDVDFYQKTLHTLDYYSAPRPNENDARGANDNCWCKDPQAVIDFMAKVEKPWIAFKILAAGAIPPRAAFPYSFKNGADFILVGMFDWQIAEDAKLASHVFELVSAPGSMRTRPWFGAPRKAHFA